MAVAQNAGAPNPDAPAAGAASVTPHDTNLLAVEARSLWIGVGGNVDLYTPQGDNVIFQNVPSGSVLPCRATRVRSTGTTATGIIALY